MNEISKTLYIPLYGKAAVSRRGMIIKDLKAVEIWEQEGFVLRGKAKSKWLTFYMAMRARVFDEWTEKQLAAYPKAAILHIGCGLDSRVERLCAAGRLWYDIDFPAVIREKQKYFEAAGNYRLLGADVSKTEWIRELEASGDVIVIMEGVSMYLSVQVLGDLFLALQKQFSHVRLLMDSYTVFGAKASKYKNPVKTVGAEIVSGIDSPDVLRKNERIRFLGERSMTPPALVAELKVFERAFFKLLFAGRAARSIYRLYEYEIIPEKDSEKKQVS